MEFSHKVLNTQRLKQPLFMKGNVIHGFKRGSKLLGIPTANLPTEDFKEVLDTIDAGVYVGWAKVKGEVYKTVLSIGWNPFFQNQEKTIEPYLIHKFEEDFYGEELRLIVVGFIRPEANFPSLDALIEAINNDIEVAKDALEEEEYLSFKKDPFFTTE